MDLLQVLRGQHGADRRVIPDSLFALADWQNAPHDFKGTLLFVPWSRSEILNGRPEDRLHQSVMSNLRSSPEREV